MIGASHPAMRIRVVRITKLRSGSKAAREETLNVDFLRVGRDTDSDIVLEDLRISLQHARLELLERG